MKCHSCCSVGDLKAAVTRHYPVKVRPPKQCNIRRWCCHLNGPIVCHRLCTMRSLPHITGHMATALVSSTSNQNCLGTCQPLMGMKRYLVSWCSVLFLISVSMSVRQRGSRYLADHRHSHHHKRLMSKNSNKNVTAVLVVRSGGEPKVGRRKR